MKNVMEFHIMSGKMTILDSMTLQSMYIDQLVKPRLRNFLK